MLLFLPACMLHSILVFFFQPVFIIKCPRQEAPHVSVSCVHTACHSVSLAAHFVSELATNGYYSERWGPFGVFVREAVWESVSVKAWPRPAESQCVSFYGNEEIVTTSQQRPAACRLLNGAHLQRSGEPREMGSDPSSHRPSHIRSYVDAELA